MRRIYVVLSYIESSDGSMRVKTLDGYTNILRLAQLYIATHVGKYDILVYEGEYDSDVYSEIYEEYGYAIDDDVELKITMMASSDGLFHIVDTKDNIDTLLYEISMFDEICQTSITSYLNMTNMFRYMRDKNFEVIINYLAAKYFTSFITWMKNCDDYGYYDNYAKYPIDVVSALVINGYLTPVEHIKGEDTYEHS